MNEERNQNSKSSSEVRPEEDPNWLAYKAMEAELKEKHMGKWVGFYDGQLVAVDDDKDAMLKKAMEATGHTGIMMKQIVEKERVIHMRSPRRVLPRKSGQ